MLHVTMIDSDGNELGKTSVEVCPPFGSGFPFKGTDYIVSDISFPEPPEGSYVRDKAVFLLARDE